MLAAWRVACTQGGTSVLANISETQARRIKQEYNMKKHKVSTHKHKHKHKHKPKHILFIYLCIYCLFIYII